MRAFGVGVDDCPGLYSHDGIQGRQSIIFNYIEIPFKFDRNLILLEASKPTHDELKNLPLLVITSGIKWNPDRNGTYSHKDLEWKPLPSNNIGIVNLSAREIVCDRLQNGHNVRRVWMTLDFI